MIGFGTWMLLYDFSSRTPILAKQNFIIIEACVGLCRADTLLCRSFAGVICSGAASVWTLLKSPAHESATGPICCAVYAGAPCQQPASATKLRPALLRVLRVWRSVASRSGVSALQLSILGFRKEFRMSEVQLGACMHHQSWHEHDRQVCWAFSMSMSSPYQLFRFMVFVQGCMTIYAMVCQ